MSRHSAKFSTSRKSGQRGSYYSVSDYGDIDERTSYDQKSFHDYEKNIQELHHTPSTNTLKSISHDDHRHHKFYRPTSNRTWVLTSFLLIIGLCILLLELAISSHPDINTVSQVGPRSLEVREVTTQATSTGSITSSPDTTETDVATTSSTPPTMPNPNDQLANVDSKISTNPVTGMPISSDQLTITTKVTTPEASPVPEDHITIIVPSPSPEEHITIIVSSPAPEEHITIIASSPAPADQITITSQEQQHVTTIPTSGITFYSPDPESQLSAQESSIHGTPISPIILTDSAGVPTATAVVVSTNPTAAIVAPASVVSGSLIVSGSVILATVNPSNAAAAIATGTASIGKITLTDSSGRATATLSYTGNMILTDANGKATKTVSYTGLPAVTQSTSSGASSANGDASLAKQNPGPFTPSDYFLAMYLPNIIGVVLQSAWLVVFATFKLMEPFYQLAQPGGAMAKSTLLSDYLSSGLSLSFAKAAFDGHWVMFLAGQIQFYLALTVMLISEAMGVVPTAYCKTEISDKQPCSPRWVVNMPVIRSVEIFLVACFSMVLMIIVLNRRRVSGVYSDPSRIATMADILVHKPFIQEIRDLPPMATKSQIEHDLEDSQYMLGTFVADSGKQQYGIIKLGTDTSRSFVKEPVLVSSYRRMNDNIESMVERVNSTLPYLADVICLILCTALFTIVLTYRFLPNTTGKNFNQWMNSGLRGNIGPRLLLSTLAVSVSFLIKRKERSQRLSHPYVLLNKRPQPARETITAGTRATQFSALYKAFYNRDISLALLSLAAILVDVVVVLVPGIPQTAAQTATVYLASTYLTLSLLAIVVAVQVRITFKEWQTGHFEYPETLAAVFMRLCASRFAEEKNMQEEWKKEMGSSPVPEFGDDNNEKQRERYEGIDGQRRYIFRCMEGVDGIQRHMVDEDCSPRRS